VINAALATTGVTPSAPTIDSGQSITLSGAWTGGTANFQVKWYSDTGSTCTTGSTLFATNNGLASSPNSILVSPTTNTRYCYTVGDSATTNSITAISANDLVTVNPTLTTTGVTPSAPTIDNGQSITLSGAWTGGTANFQVKWYSGTGSTCTTGSTLFATNNGLASSPNSVSVSPTTNTRYCYTVGDSATSNSVTAISANDLVTVNPTLTTTGVTPSAPTIDSGQSITLSGAWTGGTANFQVKWYSDTGSTCTTGSTLLYTYNGLASSPNSISVSPTTNTRYCYTVGDSASTNSITAISANDLVTVNLALQVSIAPSSQTKGTGQSYTITAVASQGTPSYTYQWYNYSGGSWVAISGKIANTLTQTSGTGYGIFTYRIQVTDSAYSNSIIYSSNSLLYVVLPPSLTITTNPTTYGSTDLISTTANQIGDTVKIQYCTGTSACSSFTDWAIGTTTASNTICDTTPSMPNCWTGGSYNIYANDITIGLTTNALLTINKAPVLITLTESSPCNAANVAWATAQTCTATASFPTIGNQIIGKLYLNNALKSTSSGATNSITDAETEWIGTYAYVANSPTNTNYSANSINNAFNSYQPLKFSNVSTLSTITPASSFTSNTYYPYVLFNITNADASNAITYSYTIKTGATTIASASGQSLIYYILPFTEPTALGGYNFTFTENQLNSPNVLTLTANIITNMSLIMGWNGVNSPAIQYLPIFINTPTWSSKPLSYDINGLNNITYGSVWNGFTGITFLTGSNTITFPTNGIIEYRLHYQFQSGQAYSFLTNNTIDSSIPANIILDPFQIIASATIPSPPTTRLFTDILTFDQNNMGNLSATTNYGFTLLINNYTMNPGVSFTGNYFGVYMSQSGFNNPPASISNITVISTASSHFVTKNNFCPITIANASYTLYEPYLVDANGSLYTFNLYLGGGYGGTGFWMQTEKQVGGTYVQVNQFHIPSVPFANPLESNGATYRFAFMDPTCTSLVYTSPSLIWTSPINIFLPVNITIPTIPKYNVTTACHTYIIGNNSFINCKGIDHAGNVNNWNIVVYNITSILGTNSLVYQTNYTTSSFNWTYHVSNRSAQLSVIGIITMSNHSKYQVLNYPYNSYSYIPALPAGGAILAVLLLFTLIFAGATNKSIMMVTTCLALFIGQILQIIPLSTLTFWGIVVPASILIILFETDKL
jgi:hypothetical protein